MIHFFPMFSNDAENSPYGDAIRSTEIEYRIHARVLSKNYKNVLGYFFSFIPNLFLFSITNAWWSLVRARPVPDLVVISSDIEAIVFGLVRFFRRRSTRIALTPFIFTARRGTWVNAMRRRYYGLVLRLVDVAIVHSYLEAERYAAVFPGVHTHFAFVPYGLDVDRREALIAEAAGKPAHPRSLVVTAGKSGRDYTTLFDAMTNTNAELRVICDFAPAIPPIPTDADIKIMSDCHGYEYLRELAAADIVVVPVASSDISVGQMVLLQAKALGRPVIATDTPTMAGYACDGVDTLLVPPGDAMAMRAAIERLITDPALRKQLGEAAMSSFLQENTTAGFMRGLIAAVTLDHQKIR